MGFVAAAVLFGFIVMKLCDQFDVRVLGGFVLAGLAVAAWRSPTAFSEGLAAFILYEGEQAQKLLQPLLDAVVARLQGRSSPPAGSGLT